MNVDRTTTRFFDAGVVVAAAGSPTGGSAVLLDICVLGYLVPLTTLAALAEAERNVRAKLPGALTRFQHIVREVPWRLVDLPDPAQIAVYSEFVFEDDHIVAAAVAAAAVLSITLDQRLMRRLVGLDLPIMSCSPGTFLEEMLPTHPEYTVIRPERAVKEPE